MAGGKIRFDTLQYQREMRSEARELGIKLPKKIPQTLKQAQEWLNAQVDEYVPYNCKREEDISLTIRCENGCSYFKDWGYWEGKCKNPLGKAYPDEGKVWKCLDSFRKPDPDESKCLESCKELSTKKICEEAHYEKRPRSPTFKRVLSRSIDIKEAGICNSLTSSDKCNVFASSGNTLLSLSVAPSRKGIIITDLADGKTTLLQFNPLSPREYLESMARQADMGRVAVMLHGSDSARRYEKAYNSDPLVTTMDYTIDSIAASRTQNGEFRVFARLTLEDKAGFRTTKYAEYDLKRNTLHFIKVPLEYFDGDFETEADGRLNILKYGMRFSLANIDYEDDHTFQLTPNGEKGFISDW